MQHKRNLMSIVEKPKPVLSWAKTLTWLLCLILLIPLPLAVAQDEGALFNPYPLRPADTSSPRDTLSSFNKNVNEAVFRQA